MKYFFDTEFHEYKSNPLMGRSVYTIDLISIGIVSEDGREFYAISKEFDIELAWNKWQQRTGQGDINYLEPKEYWIRENVLKPIYNELQEYHNNVCDDKIRDPFGDYDILVYLISKYGKSNKQIAEEIKEFTGYPNYYPKNSVMRNTKTTKPEFYGYYSDYDWVVFCWLFGRMIDLPEGFPMYCIDLKQTMDNFIVGNQDILKDYDEDLSTNKFYKLEDMKSHPDYPKNDNKHNALDDAKWNLELYKFLLKL
jgi:hypothetical protein